jgi:hypothetical protein
MEVTGGQAMNTEGAILSFIAQQIECPIATASIHSQMNEETHWQIVNFVIWRCRLVNLLCPQFPRHSCRHSHLTIRLNPTDVKRESLTDFPPRFLRSQRESFFALPLSQSIQVHLAIRDVFFLFETRRQNFKRVCEMYRKKRK